MASLYGWDYYVCIDTIFAFYGYLVVCLFVCLFFFCPWLSWMFEHDCLDTCCFGCLIYIYMLVFYILYLHLFRAVERI